MNIQEWLAEGEQWIAEYLKAPVVTVVLPSGNVLTYHELSDELSAWHERRSAQLKEIQQNTLA